MASNWYHSIKQWVKELDDDGWLSPLLIFVLWFGMLGYCKLIMQMATTQ